MKANELMIGDWVRIKDNVEDDAYFMHDDMHPGQSVKTEEILSNGINPDWCGGEINDYLPEDAIEPIPLTADILEKNGFEKIYDEYKLPNYRIKWKSYTELFFTVFTGVDGFWNHVGLGVIIGGVPATLDYVHDLQHALRLCGITREIIL